MRDDDMAVTTPGEPERSRSLSERFQDLAKAKLTVGTVVAFIALLGVFACLAAGVGYLTHYLGRR